MKLNSWSGWAFDARGRPTTDPEAAVAGLLRPIGDHKGANLAMAVGILSTLLSGAGYGSELGSLETGAHAGRDGQFMLAIDVARFVDVAVFKSRMDERSMNLGYDLMGNMRLKTVTVRKGKFSRLDIQDESETGVRVFGTVRDAGVPVSRAMVTAISSDSEGIFGMGIRAKPTDTDQRGEGIHDALIVSG